MNSFQKKIFIFTVSFLLLVCQYSLAQQWTEDSAREAAFKDIRQNIDVSPYAVIDPNFAENQEALRRNKQKIGNRFITSSDPATDTDLPIAYIVSEIDNKNKILSITTFYNKEGIPLVVRLFSGFHYPRTGYNYCVTDYTDIGGKMRKAGELISVHFQISDDEVLYFNPEGQCTYHAKY